MMEYADCCRYRCCGRSWGSVSVGLSGVVLRVTHRSHRRHRRRLQYLERQFNEDAADIKLEDVHDVAGVLKLYLRKLPAPLIPFGSYADFIAAGQKFNAKDERRWARFKELVAVLPKENFDLL
jgi:hypothetical protein